MAYGQLTVGDLRRAVEGLEDADIVLVIPHLWTDVKNFGTDKRPDYAYPWDQYQTRFVQNAYRANDDRYSGPCLLIELGALGD